MGIENSTGVVPETAWPGGVLPETDPLHQILKAEEPNQPTGLEPEPAEVEE